MMRTRSGKTLTELLVMVTVLLGLTGLLAHTAQKVYAAAAQPQVRAESKGVSPKGVSRAGGAYFLSPGGRQRAQVP